MAGVLPSSRTRDPHSRHTTDVENPPRAECDSQLGTSNFYQDYRLTVVLTVETTQCGVFDSAPPRAYTPRPSTARGCTCQPWWSSNSVATVISKRQQATPTAILNSGRSPPRGPATPGQAEEQSQGQRPKCALASSRAQTLSLVSGCLESRSCTSLERRQDLENTHCLGLTGRGAGCPLTRGQEADSGHIRGRGTSEPTHVLLQVLAARLLASPCPAAINHHLTPL